MYAKVKKSILELGALGPLLAFTVLAPGIGVLALGASHPVWLPFFRTNPDATILTFMLTVTLLTGLSLIPTHALSLTTGLLYGVVQGTFMASVCVVLAAYCSYKISGQVVGDRALAALRQRPQADQLFRELLKQNSLRTIMIIALLRLSPLMPFAATNVLLAAARLKLLDFLMGSFLGLFPRVFLVVLAGAGLGELNFNHGAGQELLLLGILSTVLILVITGRLAKKTLGRVVGASHSAP